jgi:IMP dehydrogenase
MNEPPLALAYDDVLLVPRRSSIRSRRDVSTRSNLVRGVEIEVPILSANMDTVTTAPMAIAMGQLGGVGVIHRFIPIDEQAAEVRRVKRYLSHVVVDPHFIAPDATLARARAEAQRLRVTGLLVTGAGGVLLGILTARDLLAGAPDDPVSAVMTPAERLVTADAGISLDQARKLLHEHRIEKLPLLDENGKLAGLITLRDITARQQFPDATRDERGRLRVGAAVGVRGRYQERAAALVEAEADMLVVDIAHGHADHALRAVAWLKEAHPQVPIMAGNVATAEGFRDLVEAGADAVKVGIGPGYACTTRRVAGVGVPQLSAVLDCAGAARDTGVPLVADGGIRGPGDVAKAIAAGASTVMVGGVLAGRAESPGEVVRRGGQLYKVFRGMASRSAAAARLAAEAPEDSLDEYVPEGEEMEFPLRGPAAEVVQELVGGLRSAMSYLDAATIPELWEKARFVRQTDAGRREGAPRTEG